MGKGSTRRPADVEDDELDENWDRTFSKKKRKPRESVEAAARRIGQLELRLRDE